MFHLHSLIQQLHQLVVYIQKLNINVMLLQYVLYVFLILDYLQSKLQVEVELQVTCQCTLVVVVLPVAVHNPLPVQWQPEAHILKLY